MKRVHLNSLYARLRRKSGVGDISPGADFTSNTSNRGGSLEQQEASISSFGDAIDFVQGEAEAVNLAQQSRPNDPIVVVDDRGIIVGADTTPEDQADNSVPGVVNEPAVVITGTRTPDGSFSTAPGPAPSSGPLAKSQQTKTTSTTDLLLVLGGALVLSKVVGVW